MGVPHKYFAQLKDGESVTLEDGRVIHSEDVVAPKDPDFVFMILDCPSMEVLTCMSQNSSLVQRMKNCKLILHITPQVNSMISMMLQYHNLLYFRKLFAQMSEFSPKHKSLFFPLILQ